MASSSIRQADPAPRAVGNSRIAVLVVVAVSLLAARSVAQGLYANDAPKQPGAPSWQVQLAKLPPFDPPRTPDGRPDLRGTWAGPNGGDDIEEHPYVDISSPQEETYI